MLKRLTIFCVFVFLLAVPAQAQESSLTLPGSFPTLAPLSFPLNSMTLPQTTANTPTPLPSKNLKKVKGFTLPAVPLPNLSKVSSAAAGLMRKFKLNDAAKKLLLDIVAYLWSLVSTYWTKADPIIRKVLTDLIAKLPNAIRGFMTVFIPFLTMTGKVILGVIGGIIAFKVLFFILGKILGSVFSGKRRRR